MGEIVKQSNNLMKKAFNFSIYLLYFATPFESVGLIPGLSVVKFVSLLFVFYALLRFKNIPLPKSKFLTYYFYYASFAMISIVWSIDIEATLISSFGTILPTFIITVFLLNGIQDKKQVTNIFKSYALGSILVSLYAIYMFLTGFQFQENTNEARVTVLGQDQNELSFLLIFGISSLMYLFKFKNYSKKLNLLILLSASIMAFTVLSTGSRTGFILLFFITTIFAVTYFKGVKITLGIPFVIVFAMLIFSYLPENTSYRLLETYNQIERGDFTNREDIWNDGFNAFIGLERYLFGTGHHTFKTLMKNTYGTSVAGHNTYFITLVELGLIGLFLYFKILLYLCRKTWILIKRDSWFFSVLIVPLLLAMLTLGLENRRWLFFIGVIIIKLVEFGNSNTKSTIK